VLEACVQNGQGEQDNSIVIEEIRRRFYEEVIVARQPLIDCRNLGSFCQNLRGERRMFMPGRLT